MLQELADFVLDPGKKDKTIFDGLEHVPVIFSEIRREFDEDGLYLEDERGWYKVETYFFEKGIYVTELFTRDALCKNGFMRDQSKQTTSFEEAVQLHYDVLNRLKKSQN